MAKELLVSVAIGAVLQGSYMAAFGGAKRTMDTLGAASTKLKKQHDQLGEAMQRAMGKLSGGTHYGTEKTWTSPAYLSDGSHTVRVRVQNQYGMWSDWGAAALPVTNTPGAVTDATAEEFGDGAFDKGIRFTIPLTWAIGTETRQTFGATLRPYTSDAGARVDVDGRLYESIREYHTQSLDPDWGRVWR